MSVLLSDKFICMMSESSMPWFIFFFGAITVQKDVKVVA